MVENRREGTRTRQRTLLDPGRHFTIARVRWPFLCRRIAEQLSGKDSLRFADPDPEIEVEARRLAALLIDRGKDGGGGRAKRDWQRVDANSANDSNGRSIGVEHDCRIPDYSGLKRQACPLQRRSEVQHRPFP